ncbi:MAG: hypothetical protein HY747_12160 [Elusimicrobia bacterium]|nr:hypothetical protein [Elusimicrobiota bacterium]
MAVRFFMGRAAIFIDGAYLDFVVHELKSSRISIDFERLSVALAEGKEILRTYYYH